MLPSCTASPARKPRLCKQLKTLPVESSADLPVTANNRLVHVRQKVVTGQDSPQADDKVAFVVHLGRGG